MKKDKPKRMEEMRVVPNFGYVLVLDRALQRQLDDLNEMKKLNPNIKINIKNK